MADDDSDTNFLSLIWNNHISNFKNLLSSLQEKTTLSDATLACEGKLFPVHKFVLSTCSDFFLRVFDSTPCNHPVIVLQDILPQHVHYLLSYMYGGQVSVAQHHLPALIKAAEALQIKGLSVNEDEEKSPIKDSPKSTEYHCFSPERCRVGDGKQLSSSKRKKIGEPKNDDEEDENNVPLYKSPKNKSQSQEPEEYMHNNNSVSSQNNSQYPKSSLVNEYKNCSNLATEDISYSNNYHSNDTTTSFQCQEVKQEVVPNEYYEPPDSNDNQWNSNDDIKTWSHQNDNEVQTEETHSLKASVDEEQTETEITNQLMMPTSIFDYVSPSNSTSLVPNESLVFPKMYSPHFNKYPESSYEVTPQSSKFLKKCPYSFCNYVAERESWLETHLRKHTGERPYNCPYCDHKSSQKSNLTTHIKRKHNIQV